MKGDSENILSVSLAVLSGWNVAVLTWFLFAISAAALMSKVGYMGGVNRLLFILIVLIAIGVGIFVGRKLYPKFRMLKWKWKIGWLAFLMTVTAVLFPAPFTYFIS